jgi:hypothetical protein
MVNLDITGNNASADGGFVRLNGSLNVNGTFFVGTGNVAMENSGALAGGVFNLNGGALGIYGSGGTQTLTLSNDVTVRGHGTLGSFVGVSGATGNLVNNGTIIGSNNGQVLHISAATAFTNNGRVQAGDNNLGILTLNNAWSSASGVLAVDGGTLNLGGTFNTAALNVANFDRNGGNLNLTGALDNTSATLAINTTTGSLRVNGGSVTGGTVAVTSPAGFSFANSGNNRLINVAINGDASANGGFVRVSGSLSVTGTFDVGNGNMAVEGSGTLNSGLYNLVGGNLGIYGTVGAQTLTVNPAATIAGFGSVGAFVGVNGTEGNLVNIGLIRADVAGQTLQINPQNSFTNINDIQAGNGNTGVLTINTNWSGPNGQLIIDGGTLNLGGTFATADLNQNAIQRNGGIVNITGALDNTDDTLGLDAVTGPFKLSGGSITGGTIATTAASDLTFANNGNNRLINVTIDGDASADGGFVRVSGSLAVTGTFDVGNGNLGVENSGSLTSGVFTLDGGTLGIYGSSGNQTLTLGTQTTVSGLGAVGAFVGINGSAGFLVNNGQIIANQSGQTLTINPATHFNNSGRVQAGADANTAVLTINALWTSVNGVLAIDGGTLNLGGATTTPGLNAPGIERIGGTLNLTGTLDNSGFTLDLNADTGSLQVSGGLLSGGTVNTSGGSLLTFANNSNNRIAGVTINGDASAAGGFVRVSNSLDVTGTFAIGNGNLGVEGSGTIGSGTFTLDGGNLGIYGTGGDQTLILGQDFTLRGRGFLGAFVGVNGTTGNLINNGTIIGSSAGQTLTIAASTSFINVGRIQAGDANTGQVTINNAWTSGGGVLAVDGGTLNLGGTFSTPGLNLPGFERSGGTVNITGNLFNAGETLALNANTGAWRLLGGSITGGAVTTTGSNILSFGNTAANRIIDLTIVGNASAASGFVRFNGSLSVLGTFDVGNGSLTGENSSTITSGEFTIASGVIGIYGSSGAQTLTFSPDVLISGNGSIGAYVGVAGDEGHLVIDGAIHSTNASQTISINPPDTLTLNGSLIAANNALISVQDTLNLGSGAVIQTGTGSTFTVNASLVGSTNQADEWNVDGTVSLQGGIANDPRSLEVLGQDLGAVAAGYLDNYSLGRLLINSSSYVQLVDNADNATGAAAEAIYVDQLTVSSGGTLDLNGLNLYARSTTLNGSVINGTVITVSDTPLVTLDASPLIIDENGGASVITASLSYTTNVAVTVNLDFAGTAGVTDYLTDNSQIVIPAGQTSGSITLTAQSDVISDDGENVDVSIASVINADESGSQQVSIIIQESQALPTVTLSVNPSSIAENGGTASVIATLSSISADDVFVYLNTSGTANENDYELSSFVITIPAGELTGAVFVNGISTGGIEGNETVIIDIASVEGATENGVQQQTVTLLESGGGGSADLIVSILDELPNRLGVGQQVALDLLVYNLGEGNAVIPSNTVVELYLSGNSDSDLLLTRVTLPAGTLSPESSRTLTARFTIPDDLDTGEYQIIAVVDPEDRVSESNDDNNSDSQSVEIALIFGEAPNSAPLTLAVTDDDGTVTTLRLTGGGSGELVPGDGFYDLILRDTTPRSTLKISTKTSGLEGDDGLFTIRNLIVGDNVLLQSGSRSAMAAVEPQDDAAEAALAKILAKTTRLIGMLDAPGGLAGIDLAQADGAVINIGAGDNPDQTLTLKFVQLKNVTINSELAVKSLQTTRWIDDDDEPDLLAAPWVGSIKSTGNKSLGIAGDFEADLTLAGPGPNGQALGATTIAGNLTGATWTLEGSLKSLRATGEVSDTVIVADGALGSVWAASWSTGELSGTVLKTLSITGDFGADFTLTQNTTRTLSSAKIGGAISGGLWSIAGATASITAASTAAAWSANLGAVSKFTLSGNLEGLLTAVSIASLSVRGNLQNSIVRLTQAVDDANPRAVSAGTISIGGSMLESTIRADGHINSISARRAVDSVIFLGVAGDNTELPDDADDFADARATLGSLTISEAGPDAGFVNAFVAAGRMGNVSLQVVQTDQLHGLASTSVASFSRVVNGSTVKLTGLDSAEQSIIDGNFELRIVA